MTQTVDHNAKVLCALDVRREEVEEAQRILDISPELKEVLKSPVISKVHKKQLIDKIFPAEMRNFLKIMCDYGNAGMLPEIFQAYHDYADLAEHIIRVQIRYKTEPDDKKKDTIQTMLQKDFPGEEIVAEYIEDESILGGILIEAKNLEYDWSYRGRLKQLEQCLCKAGAGGK